MLTARKAPRACQSCRSHLLSIFEHGFAGPSNSNVSRLRHSTQSRLPLQYLHARNAISIRGFTASSLRAQEIEPDLRQESDPNSASSIPADSQEVHYEVPELPSDLAELTEFLEQVPIQPEDPVRAIELVVRQARQTFGETLPKDYLSAEEYIVYERLYGPPLRATQPEDLEFLDDEVVNPEDEPIRNVIMRENDQGEYEEIEFDPGKMFNVSKDEIEYDLENAEILVESGEEAGELEYIQENPENTEETGLSSEEELLADVIRTDPEQTLGLAKQPSEKFIFQGKNQREMNAMAQLQKDMVQAAATPAEEWEDVEEEEYLEEDEPAEEEEEVEEDILDGLTSDHVRTHPHTREARTGTNPSTISLPRSQLVNHVSELVDRSDNKHMMATAEALFGGKGLPYSTSTPQKMKSLPQKNIPLDAGQHKMSEIEADVYLAAVMPGTYSAVMGTLVEVRRRLGSQWVRDLMLKEGGDGARILDAGAGGAGVVAWREMLQA